MKDRALWLGLVSLPVIVTVGFLAPRHDRAGPMRGPTIPPHLVKEGTAVYAAFCWGCHGRLGKGTALAPPLPAASGLTDPQGFWDHALACAPVAYGPGMHPSFQRLSPARVEALIAYLRRFESLREAP